MSKNSNFPLASARRRIVAKACDYLLVIMINMGITIGLTFFTLDATFTKVLEHSGWLFSLMLLTSNLVFIFLWWLYFVQIVCWTNGRTLFNKVFKLKLYWKETEHIRRRLASHEFMAIGGICFANLLISLISFAFANPLVFITNTFSMNSLSNIASEIKISSSVMIAVYVLSCLPLVGMITNTMMNSHTTTYLDEANDLFVIHTVASTNVVKTKANKPKHDLPGDIDILELEQIA